MILSSVPKEQAGAASAVSETAYELGAALGIAVLGSIVTGVYRDFAAPAGVAAHARRRPRIARRRRRGGGRAARATRARAAEARPRTPSSTAWPSRPGVGAAVLLAAAVAAWFLLRGQELANSPAPAATAALSAAGPKPGHGSGPAPGGPAERP